jgi:hypothetical protein
MTTNRTSRTSRVLLTSMLAVALGLIGLTAHPTRADAAPPPAVLEIVTVPAIPQARFKVDGTLYRSDAQGIVRVGLAPGSRPHTITLVDSKVLKQNRDLRFVRWYYGNHEQDYRTQLIGVKIRRNLRVKAAFRITVKLNYSFIDQAKAPVPRERVSRVEFRGDNGQTVTGNGSGTLSVVAIRPVVSGGTLLAKQVRYSVQRVDVDGSNVVQVNSQKFVPSQRSMVVVPLLLRTAHVSTRDFLFNNPVGRSVQLTYPDGHTATVPLDADGKATVEGLARGTYTVRVDASGLSFQRPFVLSRNQYVELPIFTMIDLGVTGGALLAVVVALSVMRARSRVAFTRAAHLRAALARLASWSR